MIPAKRWHLPYDLLLPCGLAVRVRRSIGTFTHFLSQKYRIQALDYLAIAVHELAQMSERRLERLVNHELSGLPTFLTKHGGLNSGFMTVQLCAASLGTPQAAKIALYDRV